MDVDVDSEIAQLNENFMKYMKRETTTFFRPPISHYSIFTTHEIFNMVYEIMRKTEFVQSSK